MGYRTNWSWLNLSLVLNIIISYLESEGIIYPFYIISSIRCEERKRISFHCEPFWALTIPVFFSLSFFSHRKSSWGNAHFTKLNTNSPDSIISLSECWPTWLSIIVYAMRNKWNEYVLWRINWFWLHCSAHFKKKNQIKDSFHFTNRNLKPIILPRWENIVFQWVKRKKVWHVLVEWELSAGLSCNL